MKRYGDKGSPCHNPRDGVKDSRISSFQHTDNLVDVTQSKLMFTNLFLKLVNLSTSLKKAQSTRFYAFLRSTL